jgi:hypothetical protein
MRGQGRRGQFDEEEFIQSVDGEELLQQEMKADEQEDISERIKTSKVSYMSHTIK